MTAHAALVANAPRRDSHVGAALALDRIHELINELGRVSTAGLLGGSKVLGKDVASRDFDPLLWDHFIQRGMPVSALDALGHCLLLTQAELLSSIGISARSVQRRKKVGTKTLDTDAATRAVAMAHVIERAVDVMGSPEAADRWLTAPNQALGGAKPLDLAGRPMGSQAVLDVLNSILHGMFS